MKQRIDTSANEIETLVLKAARGGGLPLGCAEDLAAATRFMDLDALTSCPCLTDQPDCAVIQTALDFVIAGKGPQTVDGDATLIKAYVCAAQSVWQRTLIWTQTPTGAVFEAFEDKVPDPYPTQGRRTIRPDLAAHLSDMAAKLLVPESEESRAAGAGAGLNDND